jgi:hypothetical protein
MLQMTTIHEDASREALRDFLTAEEGGSTFSTYLADLKNGRLAPEYVRAIGQHYRLDPKHWPMEQVYSFMIVHDMLMSGEFGQVQISTHGTPHPDCDRNANQAGLDDLLGPFVARVDPDQNTSDFGDGLLKWNEPIQVEQSMGVCHTDTASGHSSPVIFVKTIPPGRVPLEIGTTTASTTLGHLLRLGGVARWPYGSDRITLFLRTKPAKALL